MAAFHNQKILQFFCLNDHDAFENEADVPKSALCNRQKVILNSTAEQPANTCVAQDSHPAAINSNLGDTDDESV